LFLDIFFSGIGIAGDAAGIAPKNRSAEIIDENS
jgi:hypothetical protein